MKLEHRGASASVGAGSKIRKLIIIKALVIKGVECPQKPRIAPRMGESPASNCGMAVEASSAAA